MSRPHTPHHHAETSCRFCGAGSHPDHGALLGGVCRRCLYMAGIIILVIMISISAIIWVGIL